MDAIESNLVTPIKVCRVCQSGGIVPILNFGEMPLANRYLANPADEEIIAPLSVVLCKNCGCVQLAQTVDPKVLFSEYLYTSSTSGSLAMHFAQYAKDTVAKLGLKPGKDFIVGIGGNDGPLEMAYQQMGFKVLNVEPSGNIAALSMASGVPTLNHWFTQELAERIVKEHGYPSLITCNNCFAHMPDIHGVVEAIKVLLKPGGWFVSEEGYWLDAVHGNHFDRIYHEHVFYWTVRALNWLFHLHGMDILDVQHNDSQGGSIRVFIQTDRGLFHPNVTDNIECEESAGLFDPATYERWIERIMRWEEKGYTLLHDLKSISCYGVPAKFSMISMKLGFTPELISYAVEDSPLKVGRFTPWAHIPIVDKAHFYRHPTKHCIITAANYADLIVRNNPQYLGKWIVLLPEPKLLGP